VQQLLRQEGSPNRKEWEEEAYKNHCRKNADIQCMKDGPEREESVRKCVSAGVDFSTDKGTLDRAADGCKRLKY